jgi:hypothetical protein
MTESTMKVVTFQIGDARVPARIWEGLIRCHAYITSFAVHEYDDPSRFEKELIEQAKQFEHFVQELMESTPMRERKPRLKIDLVHDRE